MLRRLGERADAFLAGLRVHVFLLELAVRLEENQLHLRRQVVLQIGADLLIRALGVARDALDVLLEFRIEEDLEVVRGVDLPVELVVVDVVLPVIRDERGLRGEVRRPPRDEHAGKHGSDKGHARTHRQVPLEKGESYL